MTDVLLLEAGGNLLLVTSDDLLLASASDAVNDVVGHFTTGGRTATTSTGSRNG